ncbi:MAG: DNA primase [Cellvibrionales bacterium TMED49]|nr:DNA primase [Porticoccaceae bacterium]OUU39628.1 MAG: DNA primase [Cellvibrionales bacterium TMED49]
MPGLIPQHFIDDLLSRIDIVDIIGTRIKLKKSGKNYSACCPFHDEKTPSFSVAQDKQFYYCFGCSKGGSALNFIMEFERIDFVAAIEVLSAVAGVQAPSTNVSLKNEDKKRKSIYSTLDQCDRFFRLQLRTHKYADKATSYLKQRGLSGQIAAKYGIGFAPPGWDNLLLNVGIDAHSKSLLNESGMIVKKKDERGLYDRFRNRIIFPIRDNRGRTIGFGARVMDESKPKYINSPETPIFVKRQELYGLYEARRELKNMPKLLLVEGYLDVIALAQHGVNNAIATLGTSVSKHHLEKIFRYTSEVVFCFDGDVAGRAAAGRALHTTLTELHDGLTARFLFLPDGHDPDSLIRDQGKEVFLDLIEASLPLSEFFFTKMMSGVDLNTADGKAKFSKICTPHINKIPHGVFKHLMLKELAERTGVSTDDLRHFISDDNSNYYESESERESLTNSELTGTYDNDSAERIYEISKLSLPIQKKPKKKLRLAPIHYLTGLLINHPALSKHIRDVSILQQSENNEINIFVRLLDFIRKYPEYDTHQILTYWISDPKLKQDVEYLRSLTLLDLYSASFDTKRRNADEFCDAFDHVSRELFSALPRVQQAKVILKRKTLGESDVKLLYKLLFELPDKSPEKDIKEDIKQKLVSFIKIGNKEK